MTPNGRNLEPPARSAVDRDLDLRVITTPPSDTPNTHGNRLGGWWHEESDGRIVCDLCPRECRLKPGDRGFCFVRENQNGQMQLTTYGKSTGFCIDPIEKKPLNHFYPGTSVLSFGTAGCNLGCKFCQNWSISKSREIAQLSQTARPDAIADAAVHHGCRSVAFTYNDPIIWAEYAIDTAVACRARGLKTVAVTAGYITETARPAFFHALDAANVDLKAFTDEFYQHLTLSHLQPVLDTLKWIHDESDVWMEITNLVIPQENDSDDEFRKMCDWLLSHVGDEVPVHFTAFHPDFRLRDHEATPIETLLRGYEIAKRVGMKYAYVGNVNDVRHQSTYCGNCGHLLIQRNWYELGSYNLNGDRCNQCQSRLAGHFDSAAGTWGRKRQPVNIQPFETSQRRESLAANRSTSPLPILEAAEMAANPSEEGRETGTTGIAEPGDVSRPELTSQQQSAALTAASELVQAAVLGREPKLNDRSISGCADIPVYGCFVSLKRGGRLRGCCGFLGQRATLLEAITNSAKNSAVADTRMPSVVADELQHLELEIWLLFDRRAVTCAAGQRVHAIEIGRHGLQIQRGNNRGLLLPGVATDHGLDAEAFLQHVCAKAGLAPTDWKDESSQLWTFEGVVVAGRFDASVIEAGTSSLRRFSGDNLRELATFCRDNTWAVARGAVPNYYLPSCPDGPIHGVFATLEIDGWDAPIQVSKFVLRNPLPLQATLFQLSESVGNRLKQSGQVLPAREQIRVRLALLSEPALHGTVDAPDIEGIDPNHRAILVTQAARSAWCFDPTRTAAELVATAADLAKVTMPDSANVFSVIAETSEAPMQWANVPQPQSGPKIRPPAVAGTFYPNDAQKLNQMLDEQMPTEPATAERWRAALVPHAGLIYSGRLAADVLRRCVFPRNVIVIGPKHTPHGVELAVAPHEIWQLPGGTVRSDRSLAERLSQAIPGLQLDASAHQGEHAIEVELPWIARFAPESAVVGIAIGAGNLESCHTFAKGLANVVRDELDETLLVISTDMNHFASDTETRRVDRLAIAAMESLDPDGLYRTVRENKISMCGMLPACITLHCLAELGQLSTAQSVGYATSGDVSGDRTRVVGYAGMLFR